MLSLQEKKEILSNAIDNMIANPSETHLLDLIYVAVRAHRQGSGLGWSETEELVKTKFK